MHREDFLSQVRTDTRAYGRREASRTARAVLSALSGVLPAPAFHDLVAQLPAELSAGPWPSPTTLPDGVVAQVARSLGVDRAEAAFLTRRVIGRLNVWCRGATPAALAPDLDRSLRPLLTARPDAPVSRYRAHLAAVSSGMSLIAAPAANPGVLVATVRGTPRRVEEKRQSRRMPR